MGRMIGHLLDLQGTSPRFGFEIARLSITTPGVRSALSTVALATSSGLKNAGALFWCSMKPSNGSITVCSIT